MKVSAALPTGVAALFFDSARRRRELEGQLVGQLLEDGFSEVILPVVDYLDPQEDLISERQRRELYRFVDRDGEVLALRADFTPMLARLIAPRLASLEQPLQLFYRGDVLRCQEEHAGRQREFYQVGAEILGMPDRDGESLALTQFLKLLTVGAGGDGPAPLVVVGFAGALDRLLLAEDGDPSTLAAAVVRRERGAACGALREVVEHGMPADPQELGDDQAARLEHLQTWCQELDREFPDIDIRLDLAEFADQTVAPELAEGVGRRAYYDGLVFRAYRGAGAQRVGGGGRYDRLFHRLGAPVAAAGFAVSVDRLAGPKGDWT